MKPSKPFPPELGSILFRYLAIAARNQTPYAEVLDTLAHDTQTFGKHTKALKQLASHASTQTRLSGMLAAQTDMFAPATVALIASAEDADQLAVVLDTLAKDCALRQLGLADVKAAMVWPLTLLTVLSAVAVVMLVFVVPAFKEIFYSFGAPLPLPTLVLLGISDFMEATWWVFALLLITATVFIVRTGPVPPVLTAWFWAAASRIPRVRNYLVRLFGARLAGWLAAVGNEPALFSAALLHVQHTSAAPAMRTAAGELAARLQGGTGMAAAFAQSNALPPSLIYAARAADTPQGNAGVMALCQELTQEQATRAGEQLGRWVFFLSYFALGLLTAFFVIAIYLPIFKLGSVV
jgi:type IV pilus assembly protein PilC